MKQMVPLFSMLQSHFNPCISGLHNWDVIQRTH